MAPKKASQREDALRKKREAESRRRDRIRNDPILRKAQQEKERAKYLKKLKNGVVKSDKDMSSREHRMQKKKWRESYKKHYDKIRQKCDEVPVPPRQQHLQNLVRKKRMSCNASNENIKLKKRIDVLEKKVDKLRKREERMKGRISEDSASDKQYLSPGARTRNILKQGDQGAIARKVLFAEAIHDNLKDGFKELNFRLKWKRRTE